MTTPDGGIPEMVAIHILSSSLPGPLILNRLPTSTTVAELKSHISAALPSGPSPASQRLIYLGRHLSTDGDTLLDVFGAESIRNNDKQTIHLALRPSESLSSTWGTSMPGRSTAATTTGQLGAVGSNTSQQPPPLPAMFASHSAASSSSRHNPLATPTQPAAYNTPSLFGNPSPVPPNATPQQAQQQQQQQQQQAMSRWIQHLQYHSHVQMQIQSQVMAAHVAHAASLARAAHPSNLSQPPPGRRSPSPSSQAPPPLGAIPAQTRVSSALDPHDAQPLTRNISAASLLPAQPSRPTPGIDLTMPQPPSGAPNTPELLNRTSSRSGTMPSSTILPPPSPMSSDVYILWTPEGPQSLVFGPRSDGYATGHIGTRVLPRQLLHLPVHLPVTWMQPAFPSLAMSPAPQQSLAAPSAAQHQVPQPHQPAVQPAVQVQPVVQPAEANADDQAQPRRRRRRNRAAGANGAAAVLQINLLNHIWLVIRLSFLFYLFGIPTSFWSRCAAAALATLSLGYNIGLFNGPVDQMRAVIRHLIDEVLPRPEPPQPVPAVTQAPAAASNVEPDPVQMANRLVAQRRATNWTRVLNVLRRMERVSLLFVASIYPGIAERHIANIEREERARRAKAAAEAAAAAAAAEEAARAATTTTTTESAPEEEGDPADDVEVASNAATSGSSEHGMPQTNANVTVNIIPSDETFGPSASGRAARVEEEQGEVVHL